MSLTPKDEGITITAIGENRIRIGNKFTGMTIDADELIHKVTTVIRNYRFNEGSSTPPRAA